MVLLVVGKEGLGDGLSNSLKLAGGTTTSYSHSDIQVLELVAADQENGLVDLESHALGFNEVESLSVDSDVAGAVGAVGDCGGVLLSAESLHGLNVTHLLQGYVIAES